MTRQSLVQRTKLLAGAGLLVGTILASSCATAPKQSAQPYATPELTEPYEAIQSQERQNTADSEMEHHYFKKGIEFVIRGISTAQYWIF